MVCNLKKSWIAIELEHASHFPKSQQLPMAKKIACDHVKEMGVSYYPALKKMEAKLAAKRK